MSYVIILSANSDMARACAAIYAANSYNLYLVSRDIKKTQLIANDLHLRYAVDVQVLELDLLNTASHSTFIETIFEKADAEQPEGLLIFTGYLGKQHTAQNDFLEASKIIDTNFKSLVSFCELFAGKVEKLQKGFIVGVSSVAGDRGRQSNYIYGAAKAAFTAYLSGLRNRLSKNGVHVLTVKPGFVATQMTHGMNLSPSLTAQPEQVAKAIFKAQQRGRNIIYTNAIWFFLMLVIKHIPETIFKKTSF